MEVAEKTLTFTSKWRASNYYFHHRKPLQTKLKYLRANSERPRSRTAFDLHRVMLQWNFARFHPVVCARRRVYWRTFPTHSGKLPLLQIPRLAETKSVTSRPMDWFGLVVGHYHRQFHSGIFYTACGETRTVIDFAEHVSFRLLRAIHTSCAPGDDPRVEKFPVEKFVHVHSISNAFVQNAIGYLRREQPGDVPIRILPKFNVNKRKTVYEVRSKNTNSVARQKQEQLHRLSRHHVANIEIL